jgi:type I restriction enzyme S subunit
MKIKLQDAFHLQMGKTPARKNTEYWGSGHKWVSIADIGNSGKYISETKESITDIGVKESGIKLVPAKTVIMSFKLSIGKTAITAEDMYTNEAIMAFIDKGVFNIDTDYLYHLCCGTEWTSGSNKAVMGLTLNKATLSKKVITLPEIEEQQAIAAKLDIIDDLIKTAHTSMALLDQVIKSRFVKEVA